MDGPDPAGAVPGAGMCGEPPEAERNLWRDRGRA